MAKILLVDDDKTILQMFKFTLSKAGHEIETAINGLEGLKQATAHQPNIIISDVMMPKMNGYQFCREIRANTTLRHIPILICSARFQPVDRQTALEAGANDYISKAIGHADLLALVDKLVGTNNSANKQTAHQAICFLTVREGSGTTSLAINTAIASAYSTKSPLVFVDAMPISHANLILGVQNTPQKQELFHIPHKKLTLEAMKPYFVAHNSGVQLLTAAMPYGKFDDVNNHLQTVLKTITNVVKLTIFELPYFILTKQFLATLSQFNKFVLVLAPDIPSLKSTKMALQTLGELGIAPEKITIVVNHRFPEHGLPQATINKFLNREVTTSIPFEPEMIKAVNSRQPLLLFSPQSQGASAIARFANKLYHS